MSNNEGPRLAENGEAKALYLLATMYENGQGVTQNYEPTAFWFRKSSEKGNDLAMLHLGGMYKSGLVYKMDLVQAYKWYNLAGSSGNEYARNAMKALEAKMTFEQLAQAKTLAKDWLAKHQRK